MAMYRPGTKTVLSVVNHEQREATVASASASADGVGVGVGVGLPTTPATTTSVRQPPPSHCPLTPLQNSAQGKRLRTWIADEASLLRSPGSRRGMTDTDSVLSTLDVASAPVEQESCPKKLAARQKQLDYGKNTAGYAHYIAQVARNARRRGDPWTPNKLQLCSKRSWDGQVRKWRRALHKFDPNETPFEGDNEDDDDDQSEDSSSVASSACSSTVNFQ